MCLDIGWYEYYRSGSRSLRSSTAGKGQVVFSYPVGRGALQGGTPDFNERASQQEGLVQPWLGPWSLLTGVAMFDRNS